MPTRLFICHTPLQALIAKHLIEANPHYETDLLMFCYPLANRTKFQEYFDKLKPLCRQHHFFVTPNKELKPSRYLSSVLKNFRSRYDVVLVASIDNIHVQYPLSKIKFKRLETFDDGTINLVSKSCFYEPKLLINSLRNLRQGVRYQTQDLRNLSQCHHTLFPDLPNITPRTQAIELWPTSEESQSDQSERSAVTKSLFLGQPIFKNNTLDLRLAEFVMNSLKINHYFPHHSLLLPPPYH
ncbi:glycosyltransferase family 52 [Basilea psittacipulmonis]|uniref:CMP-N-acetylneuraminate-beta-galactosamide-alpha-2, 3-sialyltransferase n=1 Tax=Basilea psittacipulmonis DSM 24701 TaxID=1072685 RepID=A0A077DGU6_9BURK|nr:glycosyltransferase family 52 [Basilea psittacipulmonis]AIL32393.1 hypothetical protein IX83_02850 [Basilea psittacipulmonis DSM 24701]